MLSICVFAQAARPDNTERAADEQEIQKRINEINQAYVARNYEPFEKLYLDKYVAVRSKPQYNYRTQLIAMMKADARDLSAGKKLDYQTISYDSESPQIRFFGNTAIVNVEKKNKWRYKVDQCLTRYQATEVWLKRDGEWRLAASHTTTFQCETPPFYPPHQAVAAIPTLSAPPANANLSSDVAVRTVIDELTSENGTDTVSDKLVAAHFVSTGVDGRVTSDRSALLAALRGRSTSFSRLLRREEAVQVFDDTALFMFRVKQKGGASEAEVPIQVTVVLVNTGGLWQVVAAHLSNVTAD
jgi:hypothetical protein